MPMIRHIIEHIWVAFAFFLVLFLLYVRFLIRARREKKLRNRDLIDKNEASLPEVACQKET